MSFCGGKGSMVMRELWLLSSDTKDLLESDTGFYFSELLCDCKVG